MNNNKVNLPKFMIDEIEITRLEYGVNDTKSDLIYKLFSRYHKLLLPCNVKEWLRIDENKNKLINAIMNGYEVDIPLYYVRFVAGDYGYLNYDVENHNIFLHDNTGASYIKTEFTLEEIKALDKRYLAFAVKVEDDE